jgi:hypothetical protein
MTRYTMLARSQGKLYAQRRADRDTHRWVFVRSLTPEVEYAVRKWLLTRLNGFHCELQLTYTPPLQSMARNDEAVEVDARTCRCAGGPPGGTTASRAAHMHDTGRGRWRTT